MKVCITLSGNGIVCPVKLYITVNSFLRDVYNVCRSILKEITNLSAASGVT